MKISATLTGVIAALAAFAVILSIISGNAFSAAASTFVLTSSMLILFPVNRR